MNRLLSLAALPLFAALAAGCAPEFDHLEFGARTNPPLLVTLSSPKVTIPVGIAVDVAPRAMAGTEVLEGASVLLESSDPSVLRVDPRLGVLTDFVLSGQSHGQAEIRVTVDGELKTTIPVVVEPQ